MAKATRERGESADQLMRLLHHYRLVSSAELADYYSQANAAAEAALRAVDPRAAAAATMADDDDAAAATSAEATASLRDARPWLRTKKPGERGADVRQVLEEKELLQRDQSGSLVLASEHMTLEEKEELAALNAVLSRRQRARTKGLLDSERLLLMLRKYVPMGVTGDMTVRAAFRRFDDDKDGLVTPKQMLPAIESLGLRMSHAEAVRAAQELGFNGPLPRWDGSIPDTDPDGILVDYVRMWDRISSIERFRMPGFDLSPANRRQAEARAAAAK
jgi:hypothetical protein